MRSPAARWVRYPPLADGAPGCRTQPASLKHMSARLPGECLRLLDFQRGVIARWQAAAVGLEPTTIDAMLRRYRWQSLYREVYATFTGDPPRECVPWAAVLRAGDGAVLSRYTAAELDGLADKPSEVIHVTVGHDQRARIASDGQAARAPRLVLHRSHRFEAIRHPARTPPRTRAVETVLDLTQLAATFDAALVAVPCMQPTPRDTGAAARGFDQTRQDALAQ